MYWRLQPKTASGRITADLRCYDFRVEGNLIGKFEGKIDVITGCSRRIGLATANDAERIGRLRSRCARHFSWNEWPSLAGSLYPLGNAIAAYRTRPSFLVHRSSAHCAITVALAAQGQNQRFLDDGRESLVYGCGDAVSSSALERLFCFTGNE